jgi:hypothetical protein
MQHFSRIWSEADINWQAKPADSVENDPIRTLGRSALSPLSLVIPALKCSAPYDDEALRSSGLNAAASVHSPSKTLIATGSESDRQIF